MIQFNSDLDNTLIYSYKHDIGPDKICVEVYEGREISFMTAEWIERLKRLQDKILYVPTTTRTVEQYKRIDMGIRTPEYALVCNGGILLIDGSPDNAWYQESLSRVAYAQEEMKKAINLLEQDKDRCFEVRFIEQLFVFTKSNDPNRTVQSLCRCLNINKVDVFNNGSKVYVVPKELDKGKGVIRLKKKIGADKIIAAGDSEFDISMLLACDIGMCPEGLMKQDCAGIMEYKKEIFTSEMLRMTERLI